VNRDSRPDAVCQEQEFRTDNLPLQLLSVQRAAEAWLLLFAVEASRSAEPVHLD